ncbi:HD domain-containing protein [Treponema brennaborense]|uniref:Metal dependent phosphohydrolase n=1 Tax=Treponema brennaborense (strain DSM 12168 / CIP 105900 / DD5/3) TaxID=906968 RepID=F4LKZ0_TREBD|nr:HD domain-containing protein [Treponema brennaborense]AEE16587.1 metal dependent phosphohydrolase [Treponema brennaborense DSM 12168]
MGTYTAIRDPLWKHVYLPEPLAAALKTPEFIRLSRIRQLGPAELVYPGAVHTRFGHSIGVYGIAKKLLDALASRGADGWITETGRASWYAAALFHDIGHFPYTHSFKELPLLSHETLSAQTVRTDRIAFCIARSGGDPEQTAAIIDTGVRTTDPETLFYRKLLSGVLDPDKLDYLNRDAYYCGVPYGIQDTEFTLDKLHPDRERGIVIDSDAILSVENLLFSKYLMYRSVYWHRTIRIATAMMKKAVFAALSRSLIQPEQLYGQDDTGIHSLLDFPPECFPEGVCADGVRTRQLFTVIGEIPFDENNPLHKKLEDLRCRTETEQNLAEKLKIAGPQLLIDIPERISFESDLWIGDESVPFSKSSTVFSELTIDSFTRSLRKIRIAVQNTAAAGISAQKIAAFFNMDYTDTNGGL